MRYGLASDTLKMTRKLLLLTAFVTLIAVCLPRVNASAAVGQTDNCSWWYVDLIRNTIGIVCDYADG